MTNQQLQTKLSQFFLFFLRFLLFLFLNFFFFANFVSLVCSQISFPSSKHFFFVTKFFSIPKKQKEELEAISEEQIEYSKNLTFTTNIKARHNLTSFLFFLFF